MLAARYRFHGHGSLRFVYAKGRVARSKYFVCKFTHNSRRTNPRVAVVISKKVVKSAVKRNRIRRRLYEAIRLELSNMVPQSDIVFVVVSPELLTIPSIELTDVLQRIIAQAGLYKSGKS